MRTSVTFAVKSFTVIGDVVNSNPGSSSSQSDGIGATVGVGASVGGPDGEGVADALAAGRGVSVGGRYRLPGKLHPASKTQSPKTIAVLVTSKFLDCVLQFIAGG